MRVLFLTVSTGHGHNSCAKAMEDYLKQQGIMTFVLDVYEYVHPLIGKTVSDVYSFASSKVPKIYGKFYDIEEGGKGKVVGTMKTLNRAFANKLFKFIEEHHIDVIICSHLFAGELITRLKETGKLDVPSMGVVTDYTIHPHWEETNLDYYITADKGLTRQAALRGITPEKIKPFGIPIHLKFAEKVSKQQAKEQLGFSQNELVLVMMGSMGYGNMTSILEEVDSVDKPYDIAVVCGNNEEAKEAIDQMQFRHPIHNLGFVKNVDLLMDAAECIVTKPGGLSVSESLAKGLPMILVDPIPGQEDRNVEFLVNNGVAMISSKTYPVSEAVNQLLEDTCRREEIKNAIERIAKPYAAKTVGDFIVAQWGK